MRLKSNVIVISSLASLMLMACGGPATPPPEVSKGAVEIRVNTPPSLSAGSITRVSLEVDGTPQDLTRDPVSGTFNGSLILPVGTYALVARAYNDTTQVGASNPTMVTVQTGVVMRVTLRILDTTGGGQPEFGPIIESLTYPSTTQAGTSVNFAIAVLSPDSSPITYAWSDDCADSTFTAAQAATTGWSKAAAGTCRVSVTVTSNGLSASESFSIVVFAQGSASGAVEVTGEFIAAPVLSLYLYNNTSGVQQCSINQVDSTNATCSGATASPATTSYQVNVLSWGNSTPGPITLTDDCGGTFGAPQQGGPTLFGVWVPPVQGRVCILTARAVNGDGVASVLSGALLVRDGTPRTASPPNIFGNVQYAAFCTLSSGAPTACQPTPPGLSANFNANVDWLDGTPGTITASDDCGGTLNFNQQGSSLFGNWILPNTSGATCRLTISATNLEGNTSAAVGIFPIL